MRTLSSPLLALVLVLGTCAASLAQEPPEDPLAKLQEGVAAAQVKGDTAWMLTSSALVMLMVPGLALFYGGMVNRKNVLGTMMHSMVALALVGVYWVVAGYALAFGAPWITLGGPDKGFIGWSWDLFCLKGIEANKILPNTNIPVYVHVMFQGMFAIITPALISGALAERIRFGPYLLFILLWVTLVYCPLAHMVWAMNWYGDLPGKDLGTAMVGYLGSGGALDFAGGTVVHIAAGMAGLAAALMLRPRLGFPQHPTHPNSMVLTLVGAGLLWFGWFGFNGGSAVASGELAASAFAATQAAAAAAGLSWMLVEWLHRGKPTALGLASGMVAGLVAVTPASGYVYVAGGLVIGLLAGVVCYLGVLAKGVFKYDDSLDAFGVHGVGGFLGAVLTGVFCYKAVNGAGADGLLAPQGSIEQVFIQLKAAGIAVVYAFVVSLVLVKVIDLLFGFTTDADSETTGLDLTEHGEIGFDYGAGGAEAVPVMVKEPRAALAPPNGEKRFSVVVEGPSPAELSKVWSDLCQTGAAPPSADFLAIYPFVTTVQGNRFRFRGGDPTTLSASLERLLGSRLPSSRTKARVES